MQTHPPVITSSDCEGAGEVFTVAAPQHEKAGGAQTEEFFRSPKYLTVSAQLHLEALAQSVSKVWTLSPVFRAEKSDTPRHLSEFYMLEAEICFVEEMGTVMDLVESMLRSVTVALQQSKLGEELFKARATSDDIGDDPSLVTSSQLLDRWQGMASPNWPRITYQRAIEILREALQDGTSFKFEPVFGASLQAEHEKYLAKSVGKGKPIFVTDYPRDIKAFYMPPSDSNHRSETGDNTVACFDLLVPDLCELAGGSMREHHQDALLKAMQRTKSFDTSPAQELHSSGSHSELGESDAGGLQWYLDLRRYGSVPHGGFGLGFDRLLSYLSGTSNIRDVVTFPRWYGRCDC